MKKFGLGLVSLILVGSLIGCSNGSEEEIQKMDAEIEDLRSQLESDWEDQAEEAVVSEAETEGPEVEFEEGTEPNPEGEGEEGTEGEEEPSSEVEAVESNDGTDLDDEVEKEADVDTVSDKDSE